MYISLYIYIYIYIYTARRVGALHQARNRETTKQRPVRSAIRGTGSPIRRVESVRSAFRSDIWKNGTGPWEV